MLNMEDILLEMVKQKASDLHLCVGMPPALRVDGEIIPLKVERLTPELCQRLIYSLLTDWQKERFEAHNELDLSFGIKNIGRIRMNVFRQRGSVVAALRHIPAHILSFEELRLPSAIYDIVKLTRGLVLVTGPIGCGKSTTLASVIDYLNHHRKAHIITIEDPIEYVHTHAECIVQQREVGTDTESFPTALKYVLRQDPDIILIGEMRDLETISAALTIAETGHLVFATLHTSDAASSINRMVDVFPPHQQPQVRSQLSFTLEAVFTQQLLPKADGVGRVIAVEVLRVTPAVKNLIRDQKTEQIPMHMQTGGQYGMQTMNWALYELYRKNLITYETALTYSTDPDELKRLIKTGKYGK